MVLTDVPALEDFADGQLVSSGGLFDKMLGAIQLSRDSIYLASMSPLRPPSGTLRSDALDRYREIARHHIGLVAPRTILLLGDVCSRALIGAPLNQSRSKWHEIETNAGHFRALVTLKPEQLNLQPNLKTLAWADLRMLKEGIEE
jgi:DNA polymerase